MGQQQSQQPDGSNPNPEAAWWCKLLARGVGAVGGVSKSKFIFFILDVNHPAELL